ncbi:AP-1-like transcription factor YAP6 [Grifola frondosa]|uniref:AP-1-like transcription factor YAP6 n=1 Tax=Grifola frondosa TaxID=5627 RepID=A0A1C7M1V3_GRIFR|nr:AP-1-like transcription factor YAP6 [Grifola frondosa]
MPHYQYPPTDYTPGGMPPPPPHPQGPPPGHPIPPMQGEEQSPGGSSAGRTLSQSKRAEQNRKAQRAFRERRDQHVKALESRSQLLDAALASADEANRRWEECRALVDQLRIENAALRAALNQAQTQMMNGNPGANGNNVMMQQGGMSEQEQERNDDGKNDGVSAGGDGDKHE